MKHTYTIRFRNTNVGTAEIYEEGLYYRIRCNCNHDCKPPGRILALGNKGPVDLGICLCDQNGYFISTRIAKKRFGDGKLSFCLSVPENPGSGFIPVASDAPFSHISKLKNARFAVQGDKAGIAIYDD